MLIQYFDYCKLPVFIRLKTELKYILMDLFIAYIFKCSVIITIDNHYKED